MHTVFIGLWIIITHHMTPKSRHRVSYSTRPKTQRNRPFPNMLNKYAARYASK